MTGLPGANRDVRSTPAGWHTRMYAINGDPINKNGSLKVMRKNHYYLKDEKMVATP